MGKTDGTDLSQASYQTIQHHYLDDKSESRVPTICYLKCPVFNKKVMRCTKQNESVKNT